MAKYDSTKFYWLQLKEDFFDDDAIDWLEEQPNGKEYSLFYLKLCLKSLRSHGVLIRKVGNMLVPYDHVKLGELTKTSPDTVMVAMNLLIQIGLVHKLDNGELYLTQVEEMVGSKSKSAFKKQQQRLTRKNTLQLEGGQEVDICPPEEEIEEEIEKELEIELEEEKEKERRIDYQAIIDCYNETCVSLQKVKILSDPRKKAIKARLNTYSIEDIKTAFQKAEASDFLKGKNDRNWQANFDWIMKDGNLAKILEGNYDNKGREPKRETPAEPTRRMVGNVIDII
jgi:predicted phage replisome organizer